MELGLQLRVAYRDDELLEVQISCWNGAFGGASGVYMRIETFEEIATKIKDFPKSPSDTREITLGGFGPEWAGGGVVMRFYCADAPGHAYVETRIESGVLLGKVLQSAIVSLPFEAAALDAFVLELRDVYTGKSKFARLQGGSTFRTTADNDKLRS